MARKITRLAIGAGIALAGMAGLSAPGTAHHSTAMFEWGKEVTLSDATVQKWEWTNPHTFLYVTTKGADGKEQRWAFEGMSPNHLSRAGWSRRSLQPGEKVDLTYFPLRDPRKGGFNVTVTKTDGTELKQLPSR